ncbi:NAD kinase 2, mitochondrial isoform X2 [Hermetia illucens]|uniref:NAD kinase 2, mitochondrial isoform X2 n=1 Tax=Hermetia illucens TaxID=343691 RepID=UPI0018CC3A0D|nr:NAD kinase 2, mitochondrial isoform X2 [Hermetia illucens]
MFKTKQLLNAVKGDKFFRQFGAQGGEPTESKRIQKVLIVTKLSRYEYEQQRHPNLSKEQLERHIRDRGSDFEIMMHYHNLHKKFEKKIAKSFQNAGVEVRVANRTSLDKDTIKWADILVPVGGDGTFLLTAGRTCPLFCRTQHKIPVIGFNSDPTRSEGHLMLPRKYSEDPDDAVKRILKGEFRWMHRTRIRTTLLGNNGHMPESVDLHNHNVSSRMEQQLTVPEALSAELSRKYGAKMKRVLPYLALNEVFIGETLSARVSHLQIVLNDSDQVNKTKCSGLCVCTGTGSTSWHTSINRLTPNTVSNLLAIVRKHADLKDLKAESIADEYNSKLVFPSDAPELCYSIREQICCGVWPIPKEFPARGFVRSIFIKSRCIDASLVIDGSIAYQFNDGAKVLFEVHPEDALLTIALD